jgi:hypothetical protein
VIQLDPSFLIRALVRGSGEDRRLPTWLTDATPLNISAIAWTEFLCGPLEPDTVELASRVAKMELGAADFGHHTTLLRVVDEEGDTTMPPMTGEVDLPQPANYSGDFVYWPVLLLMYNATFPDYGKYIFELWIDTQIVAEVPVYITRLPQAPNVAPDLGEH